MKTIKTKSGDILLVKVPKQDGNFNNALKTILG